jgi:hypothetical protein
MKDKLFGNVVILLALLSLACLNRTNAQSIINFDTPTDLGTLFTSAAPLFSNGSTGGIGGTGAVDIHANQNDLWTCNAGIPTNPEVGTLYSISAYFFNNGANSGYGGLGFTTASSSAGDEFGSPASGIGLYTHASGGAFVNNAIATEFSYGGSPDLLQNGSWYKIALSLEYRGNSFDLKYQLWDSDANGVTGELPLFETTQNVVENPGMGSALTIYGYFSGTGDRMREVDNFETHFGPLPIQLASFSATPVSGSSVTLNWKTASEVNNYGFEVQRSAVAKTGFSSISPLIAGHGTSVTGFNYSFVDKTPSAGEQYYRLKQIDLNGALHYSEAVTIGSVSGVQKQIPTVFSLNQNYPNPFNPSTRIAYGLPKNSNVTLRVYNALGQEVAVLQNGEQDAGMHEVIFDGTRLGSGVYFYRIQAGTFVQSMKLLLLR